MNAPEKDTGDGTERKPRNRRGKSRVKSDEVPRDVDGICSRCGRPWPCLPCLTSTPPYVRVHNNF